MSERALVCRPAFLCLAALCLAALPARASERAAPPKTPEVGGSPRSLQLYTSTSADAPSVRVGVFPFLPSASTDDSRWSLGLGTCWDRLSFVSPYLGTGYSVGLQQNQQNGRTAVTIEAAPWVGAGIKLKLAEHTSLDLGLRTTGDTSTADGERSGGAREAGIHLNLKW
ncbi:MAG: hypothetical protein HY900_17205 [Deltaproteobacteria bacterium]|nr:hypothetical protein [Deltaproteobacteria bacterium]